MTASAPELLNMLVARYWQGDVTQAQAAKLAGIRRSEFVELAALRWAILILQNAAWRYLVFSFHGAFPECNPSLFQRDRAPPAGLGLRMYTDDELLTPPQRKTLREVVQIGTDADTQARKIEVGNVAPRASSGAPSRIVGRQPFDWAA